MSTAITPEPTPPMAPPRRRSLRSLYAGKHTGDLGAMLIRKVRDGRKAAKEQQGRWQENRAFYRGQQDVGVNISTQQLQRMNSSLAPNGSGENAYNRLRQFTDGRVALLTKERPPYEVAPEDNDSDSIDAAKQGEKFLAARWGRPGWNIKNRLAELAKNGDIDGISFLFVDWDAYEGDSANQDTAYRADGSVITDRAEYEAYKAQDPEMKTWRMGQAQRPLGDVCWRVVLPASMSVDPFAVKSFDEARWCGESRIRPREEVERRLGKDFKEAVKESRDLAGSGDSSQVRFEDVSVDGDAGRSTLSESDGVVVHYLYIKPCADWPKGLHVELCDRAPNLPMLVEEWHDDLPYFCYVPRPDPGHYMRSRGIVDDLKPIQRDFNTRLRYLAMWMKKVALNPIGIPVGGLRSDSIYNEDGYYEYFGAMGAPSYMPTPSEPSAILTNNLIWMTQEMEKISGVSSYAQGFVSPGGPESNVAISGQVQQTEQNLSEVEANFIDAIEWGCSRSLKLVVPDEKRGTGYTLARQVVGVGVDDAEQFKAFTGAQLRGIGRMRVIGPIMPKSKQIRMNAIAQFAPILGDRILPYLAGLIDGDPTELQRDVEVDRQNEKGAIRELVGLVTDPTAMEVYANFESDKAAYTQALNAAQKAAAMAPMGMAPPQDPGQALAARGIRPPNLTESLQQAGVDMPLVEDFINAPIAQKTLDSYRKADGYRKMHPMAKQLLRERAVQLKQMIGQQVAAMAQQSPMGQQQGSAAAPKGQPSPPKQSTPPGGAA